MRIPFVYTRRKKLKRVETVINLVREVLNETTKPLTVRQISHKVTNKRGVNTPPNALQAVMQQLMKSGEIRRNKMRKEK